MKGKVSKCDHREYGFAQLQVRKLGATGGSVDALFEGLGDEMQVTSHCECSFVWRSQTWLLHRYGCHTEINSLKCQRISISLDLPKQLPTLQ
jgi:hypothetical protein